VLTALVALGGPTLFVHIRQRGGETGLLRVTHQCLQTGEKVPGEFRVWRRSKSLSARIIEVVEYLSYDSGIRRVVVYSYVA
jgi:hypothetical protein